MSEDKQGTWAVVKVDEKRTNMGGVSRRHATDGRSGANFFGFYHPSEIHTGPQALMDAVVGELGEQVSLECLLVALKGKLEYRQAHPGDLTIHCKSCDKIYEVQFPTKNYRIVFTPKPAPKEDTLAERARKFEKEASGYSATDFVKKMTALVRDLAEKLEGGKDG